MYHLKESILNVDDQTTAEERLMAAVVERIASESHDVAELKVESAPLPPRNAGVESADDLLHKMPDQYTVVRSSGTMRALRASAVDAKERQDAADDFAWLAPSAGTNALASQAKENGRGWTFGWLRLEPGARKAELEASLANAGATIVGASGRLLRVRLPGDANLIDAIAQLPGVSGIGALPPAEKLRAFGQDAGIALERDPTPVFIALMEEDVAGQWRRELSALGVVVGRYDAQIRAYSANVSKDTLNAIAAADFVQSVEPIGIVRALHDTSVPAMGADALRTWIGRGIFSGIGGATVPIGVMDTGLNIRHVDISSNRASICGSNFVSENPVDQDQDLWIDADGHGTHVTGTIVGNGTSSAAFAGMAPSVAHIRFAKVLDSEGYGSMDSVLRSMDWLGAASSCEDSESVLPAIVNMSLSLRGPQFEGREVRARKLDATVWDRRQLYVVAQANASTDGFSNYAAAKNSLAIGATYDSGNHVDFSSHGPTADERLAPHVVAVGVDVCSAAGNGASVGYDCWNGTSMASPTVAGVATLLMDAAPENVNRPALVRARLMASAIRPDAWLEDEIVFPTDNNSGPSGRQLRYGLGKVSARTAVLNHDQPNGWFGGGAVAAISDDATYVYEDVNVPDGATRLDVVLTWDEPPVDGIAESVLNDLDLWLDAGADCGDGACGERYSRSAIDNVEWIVVRNPMPGAWRLKVVGQRVFTATRPAIAWTVIRGSSTPQVAVRAENVSDRISTDGARNVSFELAATVDSYIAAGAALHFECRGDLEDCESLRIHATDLMREDGVSTTAGTAESPDRGSLAGLGSAIQLGELASGETQRINLEAIHAGANPVRLYYTVNAWNALGASDSIVIQPANGTESADVPLALELANDAFVDAAPLAGNDGSIQIDLAGATFEPGEPHASETATDISTTAARWHDRPLGSIWYRFTASANQLTTFWLSDKNGELNATLDVYTGNSPANLTRVASNQLRELENESFTFDLGFDLSETIQLNDSAVFFTEAEQAYYIRVANKDRTIGPLMMRWHHGDGPAHDDFVNALELSGSTGEFEAHNSGATLEAGESFGELAATTWHRWQAPQDGVFEFTVNQEHLRVVVFLGGNVSDLRLVSGFPAPKAVIRVQSGQIYRIAVANADAFTGGSPYVLTWRTTERDASENDDFANREAITGGSGSSSWSIDEFETVEPDEPLASGARTRWWSWTAPTSGRYTWRIDDTYSTALKLTVFRGSSIDALQYVASTEPPVTGRELTFQADQGTAYALSLGWPIGDFGSYYSDEAGGQFRWGRTPDNDERAYALALASLSGSTSANDAFASTGVGELNDLLGHSSLWWTWEAPIGGWYSFAAEDRTLVMYVDDSDTPFARQWLVDGEVTFHATAGTTYTIRVGVADARRGSDYQLRWQPADAPAWLRYIGSITESMAANGETAPLANPASLAVNNDGDALFVVSDYGLEVFAREASDGALTPSQTVDSDIAGSILAWDPARNRLLANRCGDWFAFARDGTAFAEVDINVSNDRSSCNKKILTTFDGLSVYAVDKGNEGLHRYDVDESGQLEYVDAFSRFSVLDAVLADDDRRLFITSGFTLYEFQRNSETGAIEETASARTEGENLGIDGDNAWLFALDEDSSDVGVYELLPSLTKTVTIESHNRIFNQSDHRPYRFIAGRQTGVADVFGKGAAGSFVGSTRRMTDALREGRDRFGNFVPSFGLPNDLVASPDGLHVYVSSATEGVLVFERVGAGVAKADLYPRLELIEVMSGSVTFGSESSEECIAVSNLDVDGIGYTVRDSMWQWRPGEGFEWSDVPNTKVSGQICPYSPDEPGHYRVVVEIDVDGEIKRHSSNSFIVDDHGDTLATATHVSVTSETPGWLAVDDQDVFQVEVAETGELTAESDSRIDTYAELLSEDGELIASDDNNGDAQNFRISRILDPGTYFVRVRESRGSVGAYTLRLAFLIRRPDLVVASATTSAAPTVGETFTLSVVVQNDGLLVAAPTTLRFYRSDDSVISSDDVEIGTSSVASLDVGESSEHTLDVNVDASGSFSYGACVDPLDEEDDASNNCSLPANEPATSFSLVSANGHPKGITYAAGQLFVVDWIDDKVYSYTTSGNRSEDFDFELDVQTHWARSITRAGGLLYVSMYNHGDEPHTIQAYTIAGERQYDADFELEETAPWWPEGIAFANNLFYIVDSITSEVFAYTITGKRQPESDFGLDFANSDPTGMTAANGLLYVVDAIDAKVYAYTTTGARRSDDDFDLEPENSTAEGITAVGGQFFVVDDDADTVFVY